MTAASGQNYLFYEHSSWAGIVVFALVLMQPSSAPARPGTDSLGSPKAAAQALSDSQMRQRVAAAAQRAPPWDGPNSGPPGQPGKSVAILSEDLRNGGILGVAEGVQEAAAAMQWKIKVFDAGGTPAGRNRAAAEALASRADGLIVLGADAAQMRGALNRFAERGVPIVGWHVGPSAGPMTNSPVAVNVSTDPLEVARVTAMAAVVSAKRHAGVVIFTDGNFKIAMAKARAMTEVIRASGRCTLLEVRDVAISKSAELMPAATRQLLEQYGKDWTHALAINDIYFDYAVPELTRAGRPPDTLNLLSAGDGSAAAFLRIQAKLFQTATVAEPLNLHGWQLVDELNRLFAHEPVSGYVVPVHLVTCENVAFDRGPHERYDPDNGYRGVYRRIWHR